MKRHNEKRATNTGSKRHEEGWEPQTYKKAEQTLKEEERSLDIGEHGEFAPGGYYNQQGVNAPKRIDMDDDIVPPARGSRDSTRRH